MKNDLPIRHLIRSSGRLLLLFILASFIINTVYEPDIYVTITRVGFISVVITFSFFMNIAVLKFFHEKKMEDPTKFGKLSYLTGYVFTTIIIIVLHFAVVYLNQHGLLSELNDPNMEERTKGWRIFVYLPYISIVLHTIIFLTQNYVLNQFVQNQSQLEILKLKSTNAESANQLLRQQIQPHFLFNALNVLKSLIKKYPQTAEAYLIRLSDFLRASLAKHESDLATIREEIKICNDYIEMQRIRFRDALKYQLEIDLNDAYLEHKIPFFALQSLIENAIKHNDFTLENPLHIRVYRSNDRMVVSNNLQRKTTVDYSTGNGLLNLRERYQILSGDDIEIQDDDTTFSVSIKILKP
jgi:two-component system LytT family sensor kinase